MRHGRAGWNRSLLPIDELEVRRDQVLELLANHAADAIVLASNPNEPGPVSWLTTYESTTRWSLLLLDRAGHSILVAGLGGGRDHHHIRDVTAVRDVTFFREPGPGIVSQLAAWGLTGGRIATVGFDDLLPLSEADAIEGTLAASGWSSLALDEPYAALRRRPRQREQLLLVQAQRMLEAAVAASTAEWRAEPRAGGFGSFVVAIERRARAAGAHDVRALVGEGASGLVPWRGERWLTGRPSAYLVAAEYLGVWAEAGGNLPGVNSPDTSKARRLLEDALSGCVPGASLPPSLGSWADGVDAGVELRRHGRSIEEVGGGDKLIAGDVVFACAWVRGGDELFGMAVETVLVGTSGTRRLTEAIA